MIWFTADLHFGHANIMKYCNRPFSSTDDMDKTILDNINDCVSEDDELYILGDFAMPGRHRLDYALSCFNQINCKNKILIKGNHDSAEILAFPWKAVYQYYELNLPGKTPLILFHFPMEEWNDYYKNSIHLHGHQHNLSPSKSEARKFDVGVDAWNFRPVSIIEIERLAETKNNTPLKEDGKPR